MSNKLLFFPSPCAKGSPKLSCVKVDVNPTLCCYERAEAAMLAVFVSMGR